MTREQEWDDLERERLLGLSIYERGICACGFHDSLTSDRENHFTFETSTCPVCRGAARFERMQRSADDRAHDDDAPPGAPRASDGRRTFIRRMLPTEVEARRSGRPA